MCLFINKLSSIVKENRGRVYSIGRYFMASLIPLILNLATNPLVAQNMSAEDYAVVGYFKSYNTLILPIVLFYVLHYYTKRFYEVSEKEREILKAYIFKFLLIGSFVLALFSILGIYLYTVFFNKDTQIPLFPYVWISMMSLPLTGLYSLTLTDYKMDMQSKKFLLLSVIYSFLTVGFLLLLVVVFKYGALGNILSIFLANLVVFVYSIYANRRLFKVSVQLSRYKKIIRFCAPLTMAATMGFFTNGYDRVYLERLGQVEELGFYIVAFSICNYLHVFADAVGNTFQPDIFRAIANRSMRIFLKYSVVVLGTNALIVIIFIPLSPMIIDILTAGKYVYSATYMKVLAISSFASAFYYMVSQFTVAVGMTKVTFYNKILTSIFSILMFKLLIDKFQFMGAAWGVSLSYVISAITNILFLTVYSKKLKKYWYGS